MMRQTLEVSESGYYAWKRRSPSQKGDCYDNAAMESFFSSLKGEWTDWHTYQTRQEAQLSIFEYIEVFYNRLRRHSTLGYLSPVM